MLAFGAAGVLQTLPRLEVELERPARTTGVFAPSPWPVRLPSGTHLGKIGGWGQGGAEQCSLVCKRLEPRSSWAPGLGQDGMLIIAKEMVEKDVESHLCGDVTTCASRSVL